MSMRGRIWSNRPVGLLASGLLGVGAALLAACGSSGKLIPVANSEPLQRDFEEVARAAESGHGSCAATEAALRKAEQDFGALPTSVDPGLRRRLREGLSKLRTDALELCVQPAVSTTATTAPRTTTTTTTPTSTQNTNTQTTSTQTPPNTTTNTGPGGGTPAKEAEGEGEEAAAGKHKDHNPEPSPSGGAVPGGAGGAGK
jgi:hypothetical protein